MRYLWWGLASAFMLSFVKINFGLAALGVLILSTVIIDFAKKQRRTNTKTVFYVLAVLEIPLLTLGIYGLTLRGLTLYEIRQCLPYLDADHPYNRSLGNTLRIFTERTWSTLTANWLNISFVLVVVSSTVRTLYLLVAKKLDTQRERMIWLVLIVLSLFYVVNLHEFIKSGVWHRTLWKEPLGVMLSFIVIYTAIFAWSKRWQGFVWIALFGLMGWGFYGRTVVSREA